MKADNSRRLLSECPKHCILTSLLLVCRARVRPDQKRTETRFGTPGVPGVNALVHVAEEPPTPSDDASVPSKTQKLHRGSNLQQCRESWSGSLHRVILTFARLMSPATSDFSEGEAAHVKILMMEK